MAWSLEAEAAEVPALRLRQVGCMGVAEKPMAMAVEELLESYGGQVVPSLQLILEIFDYVD